MKAALLRVGSDAELFCKYLELRALKGTIADRGNLGAPGLDLYDKQRRQLALEAWLEGRGLSGIEELEQFFARFEAAFRAVALEKAYLAPGGSSSNVTIVGFLAASSIYLVARISNATNRTGVDDETISARTARARLRGGMAHFYSGARK